MIDSIVKELDPAYKELRKKSAERKIEEEKLLKIAKAEVEKDLKN